MRQRSIWTNLLFLHSDSGSDAGAFGNRFDNFRKVWSLARALAKKAPNGDPRLLVLGDFNAMGVSFPGKRKADARVQADDEFAGLAELAKKEGPGAATEVARCDLLEPHLRGVESGPRPRHRGSCHTPHQLRADPRLGPGVHARGEAEPDNRGLGPFVVVACHHLGPAALG